LRDIPGKARSGSMGWRAGAGAGDTFASGHSHQGRGPRDSRTGRLRPPGPQHPGPDVRRFNLSRRTTLSMAGGLGIGGRWRGPRSTHNADRDWSSGIVDGLIPGADTRQLSVRAGPQPLPRALSDFSVGPRQVAGRREPPCLLRPISQRAPRGSSLGVDRRKSGWVFRLSGGSRAARRKGPCIGHRIHFCHASGQTGSAAGGRGYIAGDVRDRRQHTGPKRSTHWPARPPSRKFRPRFRTGGSSLTFRGKRGPQQFGAAALRVRW